MSGKFFLYWIAFSVMIVSGVVVSLLWSWRAGLFSGQDRARYLALWAEVPGEGEEDVRL